jgi:hypothetical protein
MAAVSALALMASACVTGPSPEEIHLRDWQMAARADTPVAYQNYIRIHPGGLYVGMAHARTAELAAAEQAAFDAAKRANTERAFEDYLARYPWGLNAAEADALRAKAAAPRLAALEREAWAEADRRDIIDLYEAYLAEWPQGRNRIEAQARLDALWRTDQGAFVRARRSNFFALKWLHLEARPHGRAEQSDIYEGDHTDRGSSVNDRVSFCCRICSQPWPKTAHRRLDSSAVRKQVCGSRQRDWRVDTRRQLWLGGVLGRRHRQEPLRPCRRGVV